MERLYSYLQLNSGDYDKIIEVGICSTKKGGKMGTCVNNLVKCGFSDTYFRKDNPTLIHTSETLLNYIYDYLFLKDKTNPYALSEFRNDLKMELSTIMNTDNTLLVLATRRLINEVIRASSPDDTIRDFVQLLEDYELPEHYLQKNVIPDVQDLYKHYKEYLDSLPDNKYRQNE
jgi:hypothetical protein